MKRKIDVYLIQHIGRIATFVVIGLAAWVRPAVRPAINILGLAIGSLALLYIYATSPVFGGILYLIIIFLGTVIGSIFFVACLIIGFLNVQDAWKQFAERYPARKRKERDLR